MQLSFQRIGVCSELFVTVLDHNGQKSLYQLMLEELRKEKICLLRRQMQAF